jgi:hypothetical protein
MGFLDGCTIANKTGALTENIDIESHKHNQNGTEWRKAPR